MAQSELNKRVLVVGSGPAGLITAHVLIRDGFRNVDVISRDSSPGGVWRKDHIYPGLVTYNVYGELEFSAMSRSLPTVRDKTNHIDANDMRIYLEAYEDRFLKGRVRYRTHINNIHRTRDKIWRVSVTDIEAGTCLELEYDKVVLCSGGCTIPSFPPRLSPEDAKKAGFKGLVIHPSVFGSHTQKLLDAVKPISDPNPGRAVVIGGGGSAQDVAAFFAANGRKVSIVYETSNAFLGSSKPAPEILRRSRFMSLLSPTMEIRGIIDWFLHTTWLGSLLVKTFWRYLGSNIASQLGISPASMLRKTHSPYWTIRLNAIGHGRPEAFHVQARDGKIDLVAPARASHFGVDGHSVVLQDGRVIEADVVVIATGYQSSWRELVDAETREEVGMNKVAIEPGEDEWSYYRTLDNPPIRRPPGKPIVHTSIYRAIVPTKNILNHDFAVNGTILSVNNFYCMEVFAHWIAAYLRKDPSLRLPPSPEAAKAVTDRITRWNEKRFPGQLEWASESYSADIMFWTWQWQLMPYLEDMRVPSWRTAGNWLTWPFKVITSKEIEHLTEERAAVRAQYDSSKPSAA